MPAHASIKPDLSTSEVTNNIQQYSTISNNIEQYVSIVFRKLMETDGIQCLSQSHNLCLDASTGRRAFSSDPRVWLFLTGRTGRTGRTISFGSLLLRGIRTSNFFGFFGFTSSWTKTSSTFSAPRFGLFRGKRPDSKYSPTPGRTPQENFRFPATREIFYLDMSEWGFTIYDLRFTILHAAYTAYCIDLSFLLTFVAVASSPFLPVHKHIVLGDVSFTKRFILKTRPNNTFY